MPETEPKDGHLMAFGVGCFHFGIQVTEPQTFIPDDYIRDLRNCLEAIDTISEIDIDYTPMAGQPEQIELTGQPDNMEDGICFPHLHFLHYSFSVYLPYRVQAELAGVEEELVDSRSEHFKVHMNYNFYGPITYIECQHAPLRSSPSSAVFTVRKYLERQVNEKNLPVRFETIGPSPFHADFHLIQAPSSEKQDDSFEAEYDHKSGYDRITIRAVHSHNTQDLNNLKFQVFKILEYELGFFYKFMRARSGRIKAWNGIEDSIQQLLDTIPVGKFPNHFWELFVRRRKLKAYFHNLLSFRASGVFFESSRHEEYRSLYYSEKQKVFLKKYVDEEIENMYTFPINDLLEMVRFEEARTTKTFEWAAVLLAAILGGVVGSVITHLVN